jgi:hypothetical protein
MMGVAGITMVPEDGPFFIHTFYEAYEKRLFLIKKQGTDACVQAEGLVKIVKELVKK